MPQVSVGMPIYNNPRHLEQAIDSLLAQTFTDFELLISDNASTNPRIREICEGYAARDPRVQYFRQPSNIGMFENFDYVFTHTRAPFFMWASDDDVWEPPFMARGMAALAADPKKSAWFCQFDYVDEKDKVLETYQPIGDFVARQSKRETLMKFLMHKTHEIGVLPYALFRRESVVEPSRVMYENRDVEGADHLFVYAYLCRYDFAVDPDTLFHKRQHIRAPVYSKQRQWRRLKRNFAGYSRAAAGTPYAAMTRMMLPWRAVARFSNNIARSIRKRMRPKLKQVGQS